MEYDGRSRQISIRYGDAALAGMAGEGGAGMTDVTYKLELGRGRRQRARVCETGPAIPRLARLLALAIRIQELVREGEMRDYAEAARLGRVTRARMTQILKLLDLAPDLQEQILFLPPQSRLHERALRPIVNCMNWDEQRRLFCKLTAPD